MVIDASDDVHMNDPNVKDLGTITVKWFRIKILGEKKYHYDGVHGSLEETPVHERAKKAGGHRAVCVNTTTSLETSSS